MASQIVLFDACVLYPAPLRDLLMRLAMTGLFRARWSNQIHDEWIRNVLANRPDLTAEQLERTRELMNAHVLDCLVTDFESLIEDLLLPDPDDRHVLAAAIASESSLIVTYNLSDFPEDSLAQHSISAMHPDAFVSSLIEFDSEAVCSAIKQQRVSLKNPPISVEELLGTFEKQKLAQTVAQLRTLTEEL